MTYSQTKLVSSVLSPYLTAPAVNPRTRCLWAYKPNKIGTIAIKVPKAEILERNKFSLLIKDDTIMGNVGDFVKVKFTAKKKSFHANIMASKAEAVSPEEESGMATRDNDCMGLHPSIRDASIIPIGMSMK